jgi:hypothetical protein
MKKFLATTTDAFSIKRVMDLIQFFPKSSFIFDGDGVKFRMVDDDHVFTIDMCLPKENWDGGFFIDDPLDEIHVTLTTENVVRLLKGTKNKHSIEFSIDGDESKQLSIRTYTTKDNASHVSQGKIFIQDVQHVYVHIPTSFVHSVTLQSQDFAKSIKELLDISKKTPLEVSVYSNKMMIRIDTVVIHRTIVLGDHNVHDGKGDDCLLRCSMSLVHVQLLHKFASIGKTIKVSTHPNIQAIQFTTNVGLLGEIKIILGTSR